jgi:hypothetical protein
LTCLRTIAETVLLRSAEESDMTRPSARLRCEPLEARVNPSFINPFFVPERQIVVTTAADVVNPDDGVTSLREAIADANTDLPPNDPLRTFSPVIRFATELAGATISVTQVGGTTLGPAAFEIRKSVRIAANGQKITRPADAPPFRLFSVLGVSAPGRLTLETVELIGGSSDGPGGAIYTQGADVSVADAVLADHSAAGFGGAIYSVGGSVYITNTTMTGNVARALGDGTRRGGAVYVVDDSPTRRNVLSIGHSTLAGNTAAQGSQVYMAGTAAADLSVSDSILYSPPAANTFDLVVEQAVQQSFPGSRNVIGTWSNYTGGVASAADPLLGPLQDNGGRTRTMLPAAGSSAVDTGHGFRLLSFRQRDQRGFVRGVGQRADAGAVEVGANPTGSGYEPPALAVGAAGGQSPEVRVLRQDGTEVKRFLAYDAGFPGGVSVAMADLTGDGVPDIITAAGPGGGPHVKVFDGYSYQAVREWMAYDIGFVGGVSVAVADLTSSGNPDVITAAGPGGGPHVKVFDGDTGAVAREFMAFDIGFRGGVSVAVASGGLVVGAGPGGGPHVKLFRFDTPTAPPRLAFDFFAYDPGFAGGVNVTYVNSHVVTGTMTGSPHVKVFRELGSSAPEAAGFFTGPASAITGVAVGRGDYLRWPVDQGLSTTPPPPYLFTATGDGGLTRLTLTWDDVYDPNTSQYIARTKAAPAALTTPVSGAFGSIAGLR